ncbi:hypothetical protein [Nocardia sp. NPDC003979]
MGPVLAFHQISDADAARILADAEAALDLIDQLDHPGEPTGDRFLPRIPPRNYEALRTFFIFAAEQNSQAVALFQ